MSIAAQTGFKFFEIRENPLNSIEVVEDPRLTKTERFQVRFPRSKKRRIRKKWAKRAANWSYRQVPDDHYFVIEGRYLVCHPSVAEALYQAAGGTDA